jgi:hypothetical protein
MIGTKAAFRRAWDANDGSLWLDPKLLDERPVHTDSGVLEDRLIIMGGPLVAPPISLVIPALTSLGRPKCYKCNAIHRSLKFFGNVPPSSPSIQAIVNDRRSSSIVQSKEKQRCHAKFPSSYQPPS